jgi:hypothetical protein
MGSTVNDIFEYAGKRRTVVPAVASEFISRSQDEDDMPVVLCGARQVVRDELSREDNTFVTALGYSFRWKEK